MPDRGASRSTSSWCTASTPATPFLNLKLLTDRNYAIGLVLVTIYGMLNFTPMVLLPPLLQQQAGFPDALVGQVIGCRGIGMLVGFMTAGFMSRIDPRISMAFGFGLQTAGRAVDADLRPQRHDGDPGRSTAPSRVSPSASSGCR